MKEPIPEGMLGAGMKAEDNLDMWLDEYYDYRRLDRKNGLQTVDCLKQLGLKDVSEVLAKENMISSEKPLKPENFAYWTRPGFASRTKGKLK